MSQGGFSRFLGPRDPRLSRNAQDAQKARPKFPLRNDGDELELQLSAISALATDPARGLYVRTGDGIEEAQGSPYALQAKIGDGLEFANGRVQAKTSSSVLIGSKHELIARPTSAEVSDGEDDVAAELERLRLNKENKVEKGVADGYASLDGSGLVPTSQLPATMPPSAHTHDWADVTDEPTTLAGYGITDAATTDELETVSDALIEHETDTGGVHGIVSTADLALKSSTLAQFAATTSAQLAGVISDETGSGALVFATSPALVTPALGTPSSGTLTSCAGLPITTGVSGLGAGVATFLATPSSANLALAVTGETGSGALVFGTSPTIATPTIASFASATHTHQNAAGGGTLDHGAALTGLGDDDHPQYHNDARGNALYVQLGVTFEHVFNGLASANATWSNIPAVIDVTSTFMFGSTRHIRKRDLSKFTEVRLKVYKAAFAGSAGTMVGVYYLDTYSADGRDYLPIGTSAVEVAVDTTDTPLESGWVALAAGAQADVYIACLGYGGDGVTDPGFGMIVAEFR